MSRVKADSVAEYVMVAVAFSLVVGGGAMLYYGAVVHGAAYHNFDMGWNMVQMELWYDDKLVDLGSDGVLRTPQEGVLLGYRQLKESRYCTLWGGIFFGMGLMACGIMMSQRCGVSKGGKKYGMGKARRIRNVASKREGRRTGRSNSGNKR